ncbi:MAG: S-adenosylmethionine:tRNA ribosyltransferase-isomerase [Bacteroidales bacterium]|nr:S-adenosylmethionine:tRNA ribosyltransferase-isomerase [Bacteroidales bacterium]
MENFEPNIPAIIADLRIEEYSYYLPTERIASFPLEQRDQSKLMVSQGEEITESRFEQIGSYLPRGSLLVLNNTRVVQARLEFFKETGARIEIFCLQPLQPVSDVHMALGLTSPVHWQCLVGNAKRWKSGVMSIENPALGLCLNARQVSRRREEFEIAFSWKPDHLSFGEVLELAGQTPLPPYITRKAEEKDKITYQTVYAKDDGSVAAPTAGLHFTPRVFEALARKDIKARFLTLHVGAGTFKPVSSETIGGHAMHSEQFQVNRPLLEALENSRGAVISVGTTSMRTLESLYWLGVKLMEGYRPDNARFIVNQWEPYLMKTTVTAGQAIAAILRFLDQEGLETLHGETSLIIVPGYSFQLVDVLITNFHQPRSTLLLLVAAFAGPAWKDAYAFAMRNNFRFLSYGDSCLFFRNRNQ